MITVNDTGWKHSYLNYIYSCFFYIPSTKKCSCGNPLSKEDIVLIELSFDMKSRTSAQNKYFRIIPTFK